MNYLKSISKFSIVNKDGSSVPFELNPEQKTFLGGMTGRDVILKSRQIGFSSLILAIFTLDFLTVENSRSVCISHDAESAIKLFDRVKYFIKSAEDKGLETKFKYNSRNEMVNELNGATFYVGSAVNSKSFLRGETINNLHLSEIAFYPDPKTIFSGAVQAVVPNGRVILESTAFGMNWFREFYYKSKDGETGYRTHFFPSTFYDVAFLETKRKELSDDDLFNQEYPATESEAFISSGRPFFNQEILDWYRSSCKSPSKIGYFTKNGNDILFDQVEGGWWYIFEEPIKGASYCVGADVAETHDYSTAVVLNTRTRETVATFRAHLDAGEYSLQLSLAGRHYNTATIAPEKNGLGMGVLTALKMTEYPRIYTRKSYDKVNQEDTEDQGFLTTTATRPLILSDLQGLVHSKSLKIYDESFIEEMTHFIRNERTGKPEAERGSHDDRVMALAIACRLLQENVIKGDFEEENKAYFGTNYQNLNIGMKDKWRL